VNLCNGAGKVPMCRGAAGVGSHGTPPLLQCLGMEKKISTGTSSTDQESVPVTESLFSLCGLKSSFTLWSFGTLTSLHRMQHNCMCH
jgi:hypothetical protein